MKRYFYRILLSVDQLGNAITGGDEDETVSSRLGKVKLRHAGVIPWRLGLGVPRAIDNLLEWIDPGHSIDSIEPDEGSPPHER